MALNDENGNGMVMPVQPMGNYGNMGGFGGGLGGWGGDGWWIILLLLCFSGGWSGMGGFGGGFGGMYEFPWLMNGQQNINTNTNNGFRDAMINDNITSVRDGIAGLSTQICGGFGDVSTQLCNGFAGVNSTVANGFAQAEIANNARQIADMQQNFAAQTATMQGFNAVQGQLAQCCCDNRAGLADLRYTVATEACADRAAVNDALRDVIAANTASTQRILDQMCQDKIDQKNETIAQLRQELMFSRGQASQDVQTARILAGQTAEVDALYDRLNNCPVGTVPVYGRQPIFNCNNNMGCGCGCGTVA